MVVPISSGNSEKQIMLMKDFETTLLVATPSYAVYLSELAKDMGVADQLKLRLGLFGSEVCTTEMRDQIERNIGIIVTDNYGLTELGGPAYPANAGFAMAFISMRIISWQRLLTRIQARCCQKGKPENWLLPAFERSVSDFPLSDEGYCENYI